MTPVDDTFCAQTKEFELYLERLKIKQENAVYEQMVKTTKKSSAFGEDVSISSETQSIRQQLSSGTNIIAAMATGFVLGWFLGRSMFYADGVMVQVPSCVIYTLLFISYISRLDSTKFLCMNWQPYVVGLVGGILAMAVEVILFIIRSERDEMLKKNPPKLPQAVFKSKPLQMRPSQPTAGKATSSEFKTKASPQNKKTQ